ncbi:hypothetical protein ACQ86B_05705 [Mycolicibacterium aichiense]|uniref:hypothetical protein n=1 Tax=Mycolicibacterium aichiense TaxID=1799 RepID=UPI003D672F72
MAAATCSTLIAVAAISLASPAHADGRALNGKFLATSNGDWAKTNDIYHDEASVRSTWTINMTCPDVLGCTGTVVSDAGWQADIVNTNGEYVVKRELADWERCADNSGRTVTGHQRYRFYPVGPDGFVLPGSQVFAGFDLTSGESGGCSLNQKLEIAMPFRLEKVD